MGTLTIRNVPDSTVKQLKEQAKKHNNSMEQEVREILALNMRCRSEILERIKARWNRIPDPDAKDVEAWIYGSRTHSRSGPRHAGAGVSRRGGRARSSRGKRR